MHEARQTENYNSSPGPELDFLKYSHQERAVLVKSLPFLLSPRDPSLPIHKGPTSDIFPILGHSSFYKFSHEVEFFMK